MLQHAEGSDDVMTTWVFLLYVPTYINGNIRWETLILTLHPFTKSHSVYPHHCTTEFEELKKQYHGKVKKLLFIQYRISFIYIWCDWSHLVSIYTTSIHNFPYMFIRDSRSHCPTKIFLHGKISQQYR